MVKKQRTTKAVEADVRKLSEKASEYLNTMEMAYSERLWDLRYRTASTRCF